MAAPLGLNCVNHISLAVADIDRSLDFYERLTGVAPESGVQRIAGPGLARVSAAPGLSMTYATLQLENVEINLIEFDAAAASGASPNPRQAPGTMHVGFRVTDIDEVVARMRAAGFDVEMEPYTVPDSEGSPDTVGLRFVYFDDPDGNHLELVSTGT